jgi:uncharacterized protein DUF664
VTWTFPAAEVVDGPLTGDDRPMLVGYFAWQRSVLANICAGLTADQLVLRPLPTSTLSLLGLVRHLAKVERTWFRIRVPASGLEPLFDPLLGKDFDFEATVADAAQVDVQRWYDECRRADEAVAELPFDHTLEVHGETWSLRMVYVHMIGEYSRHNGHADLLRQAIDGVTGR